MGELWHLVAYVFTVAGVELIRTGRLRRDVGRLHAWARRLSDALSITPPDPLESVAEERPIP